ncbi:TPA: hypothetical protein QBZ60_001279 [Pasteurella multocida]|uniref:hypothetical protein n=1 Tax=Pasteurella multocida TaxID=747 RepID=UPI0028DEF5FF|nr:hypothetical protein [Pasteurella multocida]MDT8767949.1 hypothetical protein [Pasteurella multocida]HDR0619592.1 hypothetical protein [Pasteurella multocida]
MEINLFYENFKRILSLPDLYSIIRRDVGIEKDIEISSFLEDVDKDYGMSVFKLLNDPIQLNFNTLLANDIEIVKNIDWLNIRDVADFSNYYIETSLANFGSCYIDLDAYIRTYFPKSIFFKKINLYKDHKGNQIYNEEIEKKIIDKIKNENYIELQKNIELLSKDNEKMKNSIKELEVTCKNNNPILLGKYRKNDPLSIAIEVRNKYWADYPENVKSNRQIQDYIMRDYGITRTFATEIEKIACPIDRKKN